MARNFVKKVFTSNCSWTAPAGVFSVNVYTCNDWDNRIVASGNTSVVVDNQNDIFFSGENRNCFLGGTTVVSCFLNCSFNICGSCRDDSFVMQADNPGGSNAFWSVYRNTCFESNNTGVTFGIRGCLNANVGTGTFLTAQSKFLAFGCNHAVGFRHDNVLYTGGNNNAGQLGNCDTTCTTNMDVFASDCGIRAQYVAASNHTLALHVNGDLYAWGCNACGQLGNGTTTNRCVPDLVLGGRKFRTVTAGGLHTLAITCAGDLFAWGANESGQLGDGTTTARCCPVAVCGGRKFCMVKAGRSHSLAVTLNGEVFAWGLNCAGQLGDGTITNRCCPVAVCCDIKASEIAAGNFHSLLLPMPVLGSVPSTPGGAFAWGLNNCGQLGDCTLTNRCVPTAMVFCDVTACRVMPRNRRTRVRTLSVSPGQTYCIVTTFEWMLFNEQIIGSFDQALVLEYEA